MFMDPRFTGFAEHEDPFLVSTFLQSLDTPQNDSLAALGFTDNPWTTLGSNHGHFVPPADLDSPDADDPMSKGPPADLDSPDDDDPVSKYLSQILLEENIGEKPSMFHDAVSLQAAEDDFSSSHDKSQLSPHQSQVSHNNPESSGNIYENSNASNGTIGSLNTNNIQVSDVSKLGNMFGDTEAILNFKRGMEEASKFLPANNELFIDFDRYPFPQKTVELPRDNAINKVRNTEIDNNSLRGKKHQHPDHGYEFEEERSSKLSAVYGEEQLSQMFDKVLLSDSNVKNRVKNIQCSPEVVGKGRPRNGGKRHPNKQQQGDTTSEVVDLHTLLIRCAQSVATDDHKSANEQLKQIRKHCLVNGDADQRVAYILANSLEARLAGTGTLLFKSLTPKGITAFDKLKGYQVYMSAIPFKRTAIDLANKMIYMVSLEAKALHVIDFGIHYGFQWPILLQHLSNRPGGPPTLRITGIDYPKPGFRPAELIEETGRRLTDYCERFGIPFKYNAIATRNWETIKIEDLELGDDEMVAVNCSFRFKDVLDYKVVMEDSPRDAVLRLIRKVNPRVYVQAVVNAAYGTPFFASRFRDALYHYYSFFDIFHTLFPRNDPQRLQLEHDIFGREALNVVACEGTARVVRPETYKQWQIRNTRAGFKLLPLNPELMARLRKKVKTGYHKEFVFDEDGGWMVQGWKGRVLTASSCWVPV
ncbi:unnamed protein product [Cuscuta campestris]|uniref:Uncharacterized protein n=1 Tax=Cuscuta campestris TaxID=132261 RepID=A0A484NBX8_9ASTE|nr:unnamed protein product [Cuscuta campestris]